SLLKDPAPSQLQKVIHEYARLRLDMDQCRVPNQDQQSALAQCYDYHERMTTLVAEAVREGTPIAVSLTNTLTNLTCNHESRLAAYQETLPWSIVLLLFLSAVF